MSAEQGWISGPQPPKTLRSSHYSREAQRIADRADRELRDAERSALSNDRQDRDDRAVAANVEQMQLGHAEPIPGAKGGGAGVPAGHPPTTEGNDNAGEDRQTPV